MSALKLCGKRDKQVMERRFPRTLLTAGFRVTTYGMSAFRVVSRGYSTTYSSAQKSYAQTNTPLKVVVLGRNHNEPASHVNEMCGVDGANDTYCLDSCGGYEGELAEVDDFKYRYYNVRLFPITTSAVA